MRKRAAEVDIGAVLRDTALIEDVFARAALDALEDSRRRGLEVPHWRDGKVVWVDPRELIALVKAGMRRRERARKQARAKKRPRR
jgi:hypothetical protein